MNVIKATFKRVISIGTRIAFYASLVLYPYNVLAALGVRGILVSTALIEMGMQDIAFDVIS